VYLCREKLKFIEMKKVYWKGIFFVFLSIVSFSFFSCVEDGITYDATDWEGRWKITEEIVFPKSTKAAYVGNIKKVDENNIIIGGELFGLNSSCEISAKVTSKSASFDQMVSGMYRLVGSAALAGDSITFKFDIKVDDKTKGYTRTAVKL
jgi:hypothetical protein